MGGIADRGYVFVGIGTVLHFLVDGLCLCCIYLLTAPFELNNLLWLFITYNILAFLTQPLTGWLADRIRQKHWMLLFSVAFLSLAVLLTPFFVTSGGKIALFVVAMLLGIGNSLFHVWGGKQVVMKVGNDIRCLGVFVSTGVFGLSVAMVFCSWTLLYVFLLAICILATVYIMTDKQVSNSSHRETNTAPLGLQECSSFNAQHLIALTALAAFVMFRSYIGTEDSDASNSSRLHAYGEQKPYGAVAWPVHDKLHHAYNSLSCQLCAARKGRPCLWNPCCGAYAGISAEKLSRKAIWRM